MEKISNIFRPDTASFLDTFLLVNGSAGFRIPPYQRAYAWQEHNIKRVFEDLGYSLKLLNSAADTVTFLGSIILVEESRRSEPSFDGTSYSIVDGQQRLTTLCLLASSLALGIHETLREIGDEIPDGPFGEWTVAETNKVASRLQLCMVNKPVEAGFGFIDSYQLIPRVVRTDDDQRARNAVNAQYNSPVANYLFSLAQYILSGREGGFTFNADSLEGGEGFKARLDLINTEVEQISNGGLFTANELDDAHQLFHQNNYRLVFYPESSGLGDTFREVAGGIRSCTDGRFHRLFRLIAFGNYMINRLAITRIETNNEELAFDIFDALNTTGEPLTAIETFKPLVIRREESDTEGGYRNSDARDYFRSIESQIADLPSNDARQRESRQIITLLALYTLGQGIPEHLNSQRTFLRKAYESQATGANGRRRLVRAFYDIAEYRRRLWYRDQLPNELGEVSQSRDSVLFCLDFFRDLGNSLTIPILARYYFASEVSHDYDTFAEAVLAVAAFLGLRRGATGTTQGIDDDYRNIMKKGRPGQGDWTALKLGLDQEVNDLPSIEELKTYLRAYLAQNSVGISDKANWINRFSQQPHYKTGKTSLCRFFLLTAAHNSKANPHKPYLLRKVDRQDPRLCYRTIQSWRNEDFASTEHIVPQSRRGEWANDRYKAIYDDVNAIHTMGNLTLLPKEENSGAGDDPWSRKRIFYGACATNSSEEAERQIDLARVNGVDFGKKAKAMIKNGNCLPILSGLSGVEDWDISTIRERSENIGELVWEELSVWIGL